MHNACPKAALYSDAHSHSFSCLLLTKHHQTLIYAHSLYVPSTYSFVLLSLKPRARAPPHDRRSWWCKDNRERDSGRLIWFLYFVAVLLGRRCTVVSPCTGTWCGVKSVSDHYTKPKSGTSSLWRACTQQAMLWHFLGRSVTLTASRRTDLITKPFGILFWIFRIRAQEDYTNRPPSVCVN